MRKSKGRSTAACYNCHRQKVKCSGEQPCHRCRLRQRDCFYATQPQEAVVPVPESYLQRLDATLHELVGVIRTHGLHTSHRYLSTRHPPQDPNDNESSHISVSHPQVSRAIDDSLVADATAESFIRKLKEVLHPSSQHDDVVSPTSLSTWPGSPDGHRRLDPESSQQHHAIMRFDSLHSQIVFRLPPYSYAVQLLEMAEPEFGDYHTFLRKSFWNRLHATYRDLSSQSSDRIWLCRLSLVLALAEANTTKSQKGQLFSTTLGGESVSPLAPGDRPPSLQSVFPTLSSGIEFFEQGLALLKISYEEPSVDDVEALNLASHCCYILNRRKTAYIYAGQSIRLAHALGLDQPAPQSLSHLEREHRKRVWWTAFCIDRSVSTELSLRPAHVGPVEGLDYPNSISLSSEEREEFYDPELLTMQIRLCEIKSDVVDTVSRLQSKDIEKPYEILGQCLERLDACKAIMPPTILSSIDSLQQVSDVPESRVLASISLRYHQCYVLLLRPILLHQVAFILRQDAIISLSEEVRTVNSICLQHARSNANTMINLATSGKLVIFGYWDSVHLFSCLTILCLASFMARNQPGAFKPEEQGDNNDVETYKKARCILLDMVQAGNISSKHHLGMLEEVETIGNVSDASAETATSAAGLFSESGTADVGIELGFDDLVDLTAISDANFGAFDFFSTSLE